MKKAISFLIVFCFCVITKTTYAQSSRELITQAETKQDQKKFDEAIKLYSKAIEISEDSSSYYFKRGTCYHEMDKFKEAIDDYTQAIKLDKNNFGAYLNRGVLLYSIRLPELAIKDYEAITKNSQNNEEILQAYTNSAASKGYLQDFDGAYKDLIRSLSYDSLNPATYNNLAAVVNQLGEPDKAIQYNLKAYSLDTTMIASLVNIGFVKSGQGDYKGAIEYFDKALKKGDDAICYNNRGYAKMKLGMLKEAMKDINLSLKVYPDNSYAYRNRALLYFEMKEDKKACEDLLKAQYHDFLKQYGDEVDTLIKEKCK